MNELEKQIEEASKVDNRFDDRYKSGFCIGFKQGANFILEKNLPVLFADWLSSNYIWFGDGYWERRFNSDKNYPNIGKSSSEIYDYWLNNVYGK